jgi:hypothetical protein
VSEPLVNPAFLTAPPEPATSRPAVACPPFAARRFRSELTIDRAIRLLALAAVILALTLDSFWNTLIPHLSTIIMVGVAIGWIALSMVSGRVFHQLPLITGWVERDPGAAESAIALALPRRPLQRSVRLLLYHRLAMLRHRQQRFAESAAICQALAGEKLEPAVNIRVNVLLMLLEAQLECGNLAGAYAALAQLHQLPLGLVEGLQRLALQVRYEVACGYDAQALQGLDQKIAMIEMLPGPPCGALHGLLAIAATRLRHARLAEWLWRRATLICTPEALADVRQRAGMPLDE